MGLFDKFKHQEKILTVSEAKEKLYSSLSEYTGWKFIKGQQCLRKNIGNIVFDLVFYYSKYNRSGECIEMNCEFLFWNKNLDKTCNINNKIGFVFFNPRDNYWYDISTEAKLYNVIKELKMIIEEYAISLTDKFDDNYDNAITYLSNNDMQEMYNLRKFNVFEKMKHL